MLDSCFGCHASIISSGTSVHCESGSLGICVLVWACVRRKWVGRRASVQVWWEQKVLGGLKRFYSGWLDVSLPPLSPLLRCGVGSPESQACAPTAAGKFIKLHLHLWWQSHRYFTWRKTVPVNSHFYKPKVSTPPCLKCSFAKNETERPSG